jgi:hypothetical protein
VELKIPSTPEEIVQNPLLNRLYKLIQDIEEDRQGVVKQIQKEQHKQKVRYDQQGVTEKLQIGDKVLVERTWLRSNLSAKLEDKWAGPYFVHEVRDNNVYKLRTIEGQLVRNLVHGNRLKLYHERQLEPVIVIEPHP